VSRHADERGMAGHGPTETADEGTSGRGALAPHGLDPIDGGVTDFSSRNHFGRARTR
jgi:hypothetical protein